MNDINEHEFPAGGGWTFRQPQTAWTNPMAMVGFKASVDAIRKHRLANPAITAKHSLATHPDAIKAELMNYTRRRLGIAEPGLSFFEPSRSALSKSVVAVATNIKRGRMGYQGRNNSDAV